MYLRARIYLVKGEDMQPTYEELAQLISVLTDENFDWYSPDNEIVKCVYDAGKRLENYTPE